MIPTELELTNFLSYRETTTLDFSGIHLACISGANGAGKSSLLDAMTWCLFGKSRAPTVDDVVNRLAMVQGEEAEVKLTFLLENNTYRVIRRRNPGRSTGLELQIANVAGEWQSLTEGGVRETDAAICDLLGMTYETFVNSSFLLQGQADEFTTRTPGERKQILADLLGVTVWDTYQARARARRRQVETEVQLLDARVEDIEAELGDRPMREEALADAREQLRTVEEQLRTREQLLEQARRAEAAIQQQREQLKNPEETVNRTRARVKNLEEEQQEKQQALDAHQELMADAGQIRADFQARQETEEAWERWQEVAQRLGELRNRRHQHELTIEGTRNRLEEEGRALQREAARVAELLESRPAVAAQKEAAEQRLAATDQERAALAEQLEAYNEARSALERLENERRSRQQELRRLRKEEARIEKTRREMQQVTRQRDAAAAAVTELSAQEAAAGQQREQLSAARATLKQLEEEQPRLKEEMEEIKERIDRLRADAGGVCPLCGQELSDQHRQEVLADLQESGTRRGDRFRANKEAIQRETKQIAELEKVMGESQSLQQRLSAQQDSQARAAARLAELERSVTQWEEEGQPSLEKVQASLADETEIEEARRQVGSLAGGVEKQRTLEKERQQLQQQVAQAVARLSQIDEAAAAWEEEGRERLATVREQLESEQFAGEARAALATLDQEIAALGYDAAAHDQVRRRRKALSGAAERHQALERAEAAAQFLEEALAALEKQIAAERETLAGFVAQRDSVQVALEALEADGLDLQQVEQETFDLRQRRIDVEGVVRVEENRVEILDQQESRLEELQEQRREITRRINQLRQLEEACGRNGVQALLIEQALPEIEVQANELLQRLTGGGMQVIFETQRKLKSRDELAETLDIRISDRNGERPYENYSGGEQFRVNFAIRLALSRLLAHRAGRQLQTLVIDEGFGSQDPVGRQRLVEAINTIQDDFRRILVITHIDELKEAFPARIQVEKGPAGSQLTVVV